MRARCFWVEGWASLLTDFQFSRMDENLEYAREVLLSRVLEIVDLEAISSTSVREAANLETLILIDYVNKKKKKIQFLSNLKYLKAKKKSVNFFLSLNEKGIYDSFILCYSNWRLGLGSHGTYCPTPSTYRGSTSGSLCYRLFIPNCIGIFSKANSPRRSMELQICKLNFGTCWLLKKGLHKMPLFWYIYIFIYTSWCIGGTHTTHIMMYMWITHNTHHDVKVDHTTHIMMYKLNTHKTHHDVKVDHTTHIFMYRRNTHNTHHEV